MAFEVASSSGFGYTLFDSGRNAIKRRCDSYAPRFMCSIGTMGQATTSSVARKMADGFCIGQLNSYGLRHRVRAQFHIGGLERPLRMVDFRRKQSDQALSQHRGNIFQ